jgi:hypothetical protein
MTLFSVEGVRRTIPTEECRGGFKHVVCYRERKIQKREEEE